MFDFTKRSKRVINQYTWQEAKRLGHDVSRPEHILLGLLCEEDSVAVRILKNLNVDLRDLRKEVERRAHQNDSISFINVNKIQHIIDLAKSEARLLKHNYVGTECILLALLRDNDIASAVLANFQVDYIVTRDEILRILDVPLRDIGQPPEPHVKIKYDTACIQEKVHCGACGWPIVHACCNATFTEFADAGNWDWWFYCSNKACRNHHGEGIFQVWPDWVVKE